MSVPVTNSLISGLSSVTSPLCPVPLDATSFPLKTMHALSHELSVDIPTRLEHLQLTFIEVVDDEDICVPPSSPKPISHTIVQHVNDPDFINDPKPARTPAPMLTNDLIEDNGVSNSNDNSLQSLGDPKNEFFGETTLDHKIHLENDQTPPHSHIYLLSDRAWSPL